ncbi:MAG: family 20 glycosylhydrolase, partial [Kiritimatiellae bacterium]|nr:family 20 glycosylhydrolase [Kiritimatiellia bacterium]
MKMDKMKITVSMAAALLSIAASAELALVPKPAQMRETGGVYKGEKTTVKRDATLPAEGYRLKVTKDGIEIVSADDAGEFYARRTLAQLMVNYNKEIDEESIYTCAEITDAPKYKWRGLMLDDARHFFGKEVVKSFLDRMAEHKLNIFHWHLVDDQG